jgi:hypothetical protein
MRIIQFRKGAKSDVVEVANGHYRREFKRSEQPFEVGDEHFALVMGAGEFEEVKPAAKQLPPPPPPDDGGGQK